MTETASPKSGSDGVELDQHQRELLGQVLDKWSLQVLTHLCERPHRFNELRRAIPRITQKVLTSTLRRLERNGVVDRRILQSRPVAVEYRITPLGKTLRGPIDALHQWTSDHMSQINAARARFDQADLGEVFAVPANGVRACAAEGTSTAEQRVPQASTGYRHIRGRPGGPRSSTSAVSLVRWSLPLRGLNGTRSVPGLLIVTTTGQRGLFECEGLGLRPHATSSQIASR